MFDTVRPGYYILDVWINLVGAVHEFMLMDDYFWMLVDVFDVGGGGVAVWVFVVWVSVIWFFVIWFFVIRVFVIWFFVIWVFVIWVFVVGMLRFFGL